MPAPEGSGGAIVSSLLSADPPVRWVAQLPLALAVDGLPAPTAPATGATAHGLTSVAARSAASATNPLLVTSPATVVGSVTTGSEVSAAPPSGAVASDVASPGNVAGPEPPVIAMLPGAPTAGAAGWTTRTPVPACVGTVIAGTAAGAASATGVSPVAIVELSAVPVGAFATAQLAAALAEVAELMPAAPAVGATAHGSLAAATVPVTLCIDASAAAPADVGLVTSGAVASAASAFGSPATNGATPAPSALAVGADTSGTEVAATLPATCGSVGFDAMSDVFVDTCTVVGAVSCGSATVVLEAPAIGWEVTTGCGADDDALAPDLLADTLVEPLDGLWACACVGARTLAFTDTDVVPLEAAGLTLAVLGALA